MAVEIRILGRVDALVDGRALPLGGSKQRAVLAMLALQASRTVSADELIDGLWADDPPASAAKNVQLYVSQLRKALDAGGGEASIVTHGRGYELRLAEEAVDATRFARLVKEAAGEPANANGGARAALELWRGAPLADVASEPFAAPEIGRLEELYLRATELAIDAELAEGRHDEVIPHLEELIAQEPLRERFHAQRMLALYRAGRQSDALEAYRRARETLVDQIGIEPGPELRSLQAAVLAQDPSLDAPPPTVELPVQLEGGSPLLAGRERELRWLRGRWEEVLAGRVVCALVWGPGGIGKTRLVAELAAGVQGGGAAVLYAGGGQVSEVALATVAQAGQGHRPTLLVLDYADDSPPVVLEAAAQLAREPEQQPLLICVLHHDEQGPPAFAGLLEAGAAQRLRLDPLDEDATAEIAALYAPAEVVMPMRTLIAASEGVPLRVHRAAGEWARAEAAARLSATADNAADERGGLRAAQAAIADGVVDLQAARERTRLYAVEEPPTLSELETCPFRGLAPFDAAHAEYFFGRERLVAELVARLIGSTLLAVVGPSGSGKSSAVRAGLLPALADGVVPGSERWRQVVMRPGERPFAELSRTLARAVPETGPEDASPWIADALERLPAGERLVLAVDQFEEVYTACQDAAEREAFLDALVEAAADPDERLLVVLAIRADFYGHCAGHADLSALVSANQVLVGPMRRDELRRAIELPARRAGLRVEPGLVSALVGGVASEPGGLPLLSAALLELWQQRSGRTLRRSDYERTGGVEGAVARLAEDAFQRLDADERRRVRPMLLRLAGSEDEVEALVRRRVALDELELDRDEPAARALAVFTKSRLLTVDDGAVEVAHEALLREWPRLRAWLEADAEGRRLHQHLITSSQGWRESEQDPAELYRGTRLAAALDWAAEHDPELNELEREFLEASRAASEREAERQRRINRRLRLLLLGVGLLLATAVVAGTIAISERQGARDAARVADAERLGAEALNATRLDDALILANAGIALDDSVTTRSNLLSTLLRSPAALGILEVGSDPSTSALSPDGGTLAVGKRDGTVLLFDTETRELIGDHEAPGDVWSVEFDPSGDSLAIAGSKGAELFKGYLAILDAETAELRSSALLGIHPAAPSPGLQQFPTAHYTPDGRSLVVTYSGGDTNRTLPLFMRLYDSSARPLGKPVRVASRSVSVDPQMSRDGHMLVSSDRATYEIDAESLTLVRRYPVGAFSSAISADGRTLALSDTDGGIDLLDLDSGRMRTLAAPGELASDQDIGSFSPDGKTLSTWEDGGTEAPATVLWDVERGTEIERFAGHTGNGSSQVFGPDGRTLYTVGDSTVIIWDVAGDRRLGSPFHTGLRMIPEDAYPPAFSISPDGSTLAVGRLDGKVEVIDAETLRRRMTFEAFEDTLAPAIAYSPDGQRLAVGGARGLLGIWDAQTGQRVGPLLDSPSGPCADPSSTFMIPRCYNATIQGALAWGPDNLLATANIGGEMRIWDLGAREPIHPPLQLPPFALGLEFNQDGSQIAIPFGYGNPGADGVEIVDTHTGARIARLPADAEVRSVDFSPDGSTLASGDVDGQAVFWATEDWQQIGRPLVIDRGFVIGVDFSPDGRTLAASNDDGTVSLLDVEAQEPIGAALPAPLDVLATGRFTPDGEHLFAVYESGEAIRWEVDPAAWRSRACAIAGGGLTPEQWEEIVPEEDYVSVCPSG